MAGHSFLERAAKSVRNRAHVTVMRARGVLARATHAFAWTAGPDLAVGRAVSFDVYGTLRMGRRVRLSDGCHLAVAPGGVLELGDDVFLGRGAVVVARRSIRIGDRVLVAEHCTIRDGDHHVDAASRAAEILAERTGSAPPETIHEREADVRIADDVWIGAGARVLRGTVLERGCVVGANAVVRGTFGPDQVVAGIPARVVSRPGDAGGAR